MVFARYKNINLTTGNNQNPFRWEFYLWALGNYWYLKFSLKWITCISWCKEEKEIQLKTYIQLRNWKPFCRKFQPNKVHKKCVYKSYN